MTAPELVDVVAEVLAEHSGVVWDSLGTAVFCSDCLDGDEPAPFGDADKWLAQHQARAVLAALTEAGEVEWGIFRKDEAGNTWTPMENARFKTLAKAESYRKNMFLPAFQEIIEPRFRHVGPWQKLEE